MYFVKFRAALRGKCRNLKNHGLRGCHGLEPEPPTTNEHEFTRIKSAETIYEKLVSISVHSWLVRFGREGGDDFFEAWIAAQRVPKRQQLQFAIASAVRKAVGAG